MMTEPWFEPNLYAWIPGTAYGCVAGLMGGLVGWLAPRGKARVFIVPAWFAIWAAAAVMLVLGVIAWTDGQPYGVWYGLLLPGVIGTIVIGINTMTVMKTYRQVEERKLAAKDLL